MRVSHAPPVASCSFPGCGRVAVVKVTIEILDESSTRSRYLGHILCAEHMSALRGMIDAGLAPTTTIVEQRPIIVRPRQRRHDGHPTPDQK